MPQPPKNYSFLLTDADRVAVRIKHSGHHVTEFSVQYDALINGRWRKITRYDSCHGIPHRHVFHADRKEYWQSMNHTDNNAALTEAVMVVKKKFQAIRENYIAQAHINEVN